MSSASMNMSTGTMSTPTGAASRASGFSRERFQLRNAWNGTNAAKYNGAGMAQTPFRAVFNAGNVAPSSGNPKYVYDSSVYSMFVRQKTGVRRY
jgi:hypothetical protein